MYTMVIFTAVGIVYQLDPFDYKQEKQSLSHVVMFASDATIIGHATNNGKYIYTSTSSKLVTQHKYIHDVVTNVSSTAHAPQHPKFIKSKMIMIMSGHS